jgi:peptidoglycan biosynthesis protein MviN/MurJ (putative lipid II flippase)
MVKKIIAIFNKEFGNINEAALLLGFFAFLSQVLGLVRDKIFAHSLGTSAPLDIYVAAFRIPEFLYVSVASFVSVTVILPFLD